jgi:hypothetical protein
VPTVEMRRGDALPTPRVFEMSGLNWG